jgi:DNA-binding transcriptional regulator LsrR (DeoR family)
LTNTDHQRLLVKLARLYYEENLNQGEIAERLRLSRQKVQRLLRRALTEGIVQIAIRPITGIFADLENGLEKRFGLREALIVETASYNHEVTVAREVGAGAAEYLTRVLQPHDRIMMSWGGTLLPMVEAISVRPPLEVEDVAVIQGLGGLGDPNHDAHGAELTRRLARALRAEAYLLAAPGVATSRAARDAFCSDPQTKSVIQRARAATIAFVGIGAPRPDSILIRQGQIVSWDELAELKALGAVGDMNLRFFDERGQAISSELDTRVVGLNLEEIQQIGHVVGVAGGAVKFKAIQAALAGKLVHVLVTDNETAIHLIESTEPQTISDVCEEVKPS